MYIYVCVCVFVCVCLCLSLHIYFYTFISKQNFLMSFFITRNLDIISSILQLQELRASHTYMCRFRLEVQGPWALSIFVELLLFRFI